IGFRFAFAYLVLFMFPFPVYYIPYTGKLFQLYTNFWHAIVPWVGKHILHLSYDIAVFTNGSGDTTYDYLQALCALTLAIGAAIIWSGLDRRRADYNKLHRWLRIFIRFSLASALLGYGAAKAIPNQMPAPLLSTLLEPYGESSPMALLWTF